MSHLAEDEEEPMEHSSEQQEVITSIIITYIVLAYLLTPTYEYGKEGWELFIPSGFWKFLQGVSIQTTTVGGKKLLDWGCRISVVVANWYQLVLHMEQKFRIRFNHHCQISCLQRLYE